MTIGDLIPALKGHGRRRAADEVDRLRQQEAILRGNLHAAGEEVGDLQQRLTAAHARQNELDGIVDQLQAEAIDLTEERDGLAEELAALRRRFAPQLAAEANANRITVPPMVRDTSAIEDQATQPIPVLTLHQAPFATTDPGHVRPSWATEEVTS